MKVLEFLAGGNSNAGTPKLNQLQSSELGLITKFHNNKFYAKLTRNYNFLINTTYKKISDAPLKISPPKTRRKELVAKLYDYQTHIHLNQNSPKD